MLPQFILLKGSVEMKANSNDPVEKIPPCTKKIRIDLHRRFFVIPV